MPRLNSQKFQLPWLLSIYNLFLVGLLFLCQSVVVRKIDQKIGWWKVTRLLILFYGSCCYVLSLEYGYNSGGGLFFNQKGCEVGYHLPFPVKYGLCFKIGVWDYRFVGEPMTENM